MWKYIFTVIAVCMLLTASLAEGQSYGPGHEAHQYACWDNGDGTHTVACDCGIEKRVEKHMDAGNDGICDSCGFLFEIEEEELDYAALRPEGWTIIGCESGGVAYAVPNDLLIWELTEKEKEIGIISRCSNADITVQLRAYEPDDITYEQFLEILYTNGYEMRGVRNIEGTYIASYYNPVPESDMQLCGAVLTGLDGRLYKISIFGGDNDEYGEDAPVWERAETLLDSVHVRHNAGWNIYKGRIFE